MADKNLVEISVEVPALNVPLCKYFNITYRNLGINLSNHTAYRHAMNTHAPKEIEWYEVVVPVICVFGIIGNILNLIVLSKQRTESRMDRLEKSATSGLIALAFSDMMFCMVVFPSTFITEKGHVTTPEHLYQFYYRLYGSGLLNLMCMISAWLIVYMAVGRFIVVSYPFYARQVLGTVRCIVTITLIYSLALVLTIPYLIRMGVSQCLDPSSSTMYEFRSRWPKKVSRAMLIYAKWVWPIIANFIPLFILTMLNMRLIHELHRARKRRRQSCRGQTLRNRNHKVTLTLVIIVVMFVLLVSPSEILRYIDPYQRSWGKMGPLIAQTANVLQAFNFAFNFVLYCVVSAAFRKTLRSIFSCSKEETLSPEAQSMLTPIREGYRHTATHSQETEINGRV